MQAMPHQLMGYDRAITMFSPDGRLLQVEYARKTVKQGTTAIGIACKDGVLLVADKRIIDKLIVPETVEKVFQVDSHIGAAVSGLVSDGRVLVERAQLKAQQNRVTYDTGMDVLGVVKDTCDLIQICTQSGGLRPFGVSVMFAGVDEVGRRLFITDPSGIYFQYKAAVIGEGEADIGPVLNKEYKDNLTVAEGLKLAIKALKTFLANNFSLERLDVATILNGQQFTKLSSTEIKKMIKE